MKKKLLWIFGVGVLLLTCTLNRGYMTNEKDVKEEMSKPQPRKTSASVVDTVVQMYQGGGATGMFSGYQFSSSGEVRYFTRTALGKTIHATSVKVSSDSTRQLLQQLFNTGIFAHSIQKSGNMTSYFVYRDAYKTITLSWVKDDDVPAVFRQWYIHAIQKCQQWIQKGS